MSKVSKFLDKAYEIANNNYYIYGKMPNNMGPNTYDCATFISMVMYACGLVEGNFPDKGYFWPHIHDAGFDKFLTDNGWTKKDYSIEKLKPGQILINDDEKASGHTVIVSSIEDGFIYIIDANPNYSLDNQIAERRFTEQSWRYIYEMEEDDVGEDFEPRDITYQEDRILSIWKWTDTCKHGDKNDYVKFLQEYLAWYTYYSGDIDGDFGDVTEKAVRAWQKERNLPVDGIINADDWTIILKG